MSETPYDEHFVSWFRAVTPYINAFRGKTFVIAFGGKAVASEPMVFRRSTCALKRPAAAHPTR